MIYLSASSTALSFASVAVADVRYVGGPNANDEHDGSAQAPFATLQKAAKEAAAGDTFKVRSGAYPSLFLGNGGISDTLRVTFQRDESTPTAPIIDGGVTIAADFVTFDGFEVRNAMLMGVNVYGASQLRLTNNVIHDNQRGGVYAAPAQGRLSDDIYLGNNAIYRNSLDNAARSASGGWAGAVQMYDANRFIVEGNTVYENWGEGISFTVTQGSVARHNVVYDNYSVELYMDHAVGCSFESNLVFETGNAQFFRNLNGAWPANGIQIANEPGYPMSQPGTGNRLVNNIVIGGRNSLFYWRADGDDTGMRDTLVAHNTFYGAREALLKIDQNSHQASRFANNIFIRAGGAVLAGDASGLSFEHNAWSAGGGIAGSGDVKADCRLAGPGGRKAEDYRLSSMSSPCVSAGTSIPSVTDDYWGGARLGRIDIGAHQFGTSPGSTAGGDSGGQAGRATGGASPHSAGAGGAASSLGGSNPAAGGRTQTEPPIGLGGTTAELEPQRATAQQPGCACTIGAEGSVSRPLTSLVSLGLASLLALRRRRDWNGADGGLRHDHSRHAAREHRCVEDAVRVVVGEKRNAAIGALADLRGRWQIRPSAVVVELRRPD